MRSPLFPTHHRLCSKRDAGKWNKKLLHSIFIEQKNRQGTSESLGIQLKMGKAKKTRKFAVAKKIISPKDTRVKENLEKAKKKEEALKKKEEPRQVEQAVSSLFFQYNTQLGPPYYVLVDTNFINFSIR
jgi:hypothetical protein